MINECDFYSTILDVQAPWFVKEVSLDIKKGSVNVYLDHASSTFSCPICFSECTVYDHSSSRTWRHLDTCQYQTLIHARIPRVKCSEHGIRQAEIPWSSRQSSFTLLMEIFILKALELCENISAAAKLCRISWDQAQLVMQHGVERGLARRKDFDTKLIAIDEKAFKKGHKYLTIISSLESGAILEVLESRKKEALDDYYKTLPTEKKEQIEAVSMDMWPAFINSTKEHVDPNENKIVFDKFHIIAILTKAVDAVRRKEHYKLQAEGNSVLKSTKSMWFYSPENLPSKYEKDYERLTQSDLETAKVWAFKEGFKRIFDYKYVENAKKYFMQWYESVLSSGIKNIIGAAETLNSHLYGILNGVKHQVTNGLAEGLNSKIMAIKRRARGHRNLENLKTAIYFYCGKLDVYPR